MKRSEMVEKLVFSMEMHAGNDPAWLDYQRGMKAGALDYADKILTDLEEAGMLPPEYIVDYSPLITANVWEPEDE